MRAGTRFDPGPLLRPQPVRRKGIENIASAGRGLHLPEFVDLLRHPVPGFRKAQIQGLRFGRRGLKSTPSALSRFAPALFGIDHETPRLLGKLKHLGDTTVSALLPRRCIEPAGVARWPQNHQPLRGLD